MCYCALVCHWKDQRYSRPRLLAEAMLYKVLHLYSICVGKIRPTPLSSTAQTLWNNVQKIVAKMLPPTQSMIGMSCIPSCRTIEPSPARFSAFPFPPLFSFLFFSLPNIAIDPLRQSVRDVCRYRPDVNDVNTWNESQREESN